MAPRVCFFPSPAPRTWASRRSTTLPTLWPTLSTPEANIIFGTVVDESLGIQVRITVIATGFSDANVNRQDQLFGQTQSSASKSASDVSTPAHAAPAATRNVGGSELPNFGNEQFELPDFLKRGNF